MAATLRSVFGIAVRPRGSRPKIFTRRFPRSTYIRSRLDHPNSRDSVEVLDRLRTLWSPVDVARALDLGNALLAHVCDLTKRAGVIDIGSLQAALRAKLPDSLGADTRRAKLHRLHDAGQARVVRSIEALGVSKPQAEQAALQALERPPAALDGDVVVIDGPMGVGKTTELERQHRQAINSALADPTRPIPIFVQARDVAAPAFNLRPLLSPA